MTRGTRSNTARQQSFRPVLDPARDRYQPVRHVGGLYLKPPSSGGLCEGVMTIPSASSDRAAAVVRQNRMRDHWRRRITVGSVDDALDAVCGEHFEGRPAGRLRECVAVHPDIKRAGYLLAASILADCLRDRQDVRLVEHAAER